MKRLIAGLAAGLVLGAGGATAATTFVIDNVNQIRPSALVDVRRVDVSKTIYVSTAYQVFQPGVDNSLSAVCPAHYAVTMLGHFGESDLDWHTEVPTNDEAGATFGVLNKGFAGEVGGGWILCSPSVGTKGTQ